MKPLPYQWHIPLQLILWEYPRALKRFALASLDQQKLFNFPSNALFCILEDWQYFIRTVVLHLLSRGTNFHSNKNIRNYTQWTYLKVSMTWPQRTNSAYFANFYALAKAFISRWTVGTRARDQEMWINVSSTARSSSVVASLETWSKRRADILYETTFCCSWDVRKEKYPLNCRMSQTSVSFLRACYKTWNHFKLTLEIAQLVASYS